MSVVTTLPLFMPSGNANAITTSASKGPNDLDWQIQSFLYYRAMSHCMKNSHLSDWIIDRINTNETGKKWWSNNFGNTGPTEAGIGLYMKDADSATGLAIGTEGKVKCNNENLVPAAMAFWDLDPIEVLCESGLRRVDFGEQTVQQCINEGTTAFEYGPGGRTDATLKFSAYIKRAVYGMTDTSKDLDLTGPQWYLYYRHTLANSCIAKIDTTAPSGGPYGSDNKYGYNDVKWVDVDKILTTDNITLANATVTGSYVGNWQTGTSVMLRVGAGQDFNNYAENCDVVVRLMSENAEAFALWAMRNKAIAGNANNAPGDGGVAGGIGESTCGIDGIGWILCPVMTFLGDITDGMFSYIAENFLETNITFLQTTGENAGTFTAWSIMRNIANVAFVIVFLIIIFSQLTGAGIANYGIKKMLPRLIIGAILVNLSFFVCQLAVDLSNILGYGLKSIFDGIANNVTETAAILPGDTSGTTDFVLWKTVVAGVIVAGVGAGAIAAAGVGSLIAVLVAALIAVATIFFILIIRQVLIVLLIVIAPLAFVAFLLPNTEKLFTQWRKVFTTLLLLFPIIGLVFGASSLASSILMTTYAGTDETISQVIAAGALMIPLIVVPFILKASLNGIGQLGSAINGFGSRIGKTASQGAKTKAEDSRLGQFQKYRKDMKARRTAQIRGGTYEGSNKNPLNWARNIGSAVNRGVNSKSGQFGAQLRAKGESIADAEDTERIKMADARVGNMKFGGAPLSTAQLIQLSKKQDITDKAGNVLARASSFDEYERRVAIARATAVANVAEAQTLLDGSNSMSTGERRALATGLRTSGAVSKAPWLGGKTLGTIEQTGTTATAAALESISDGKITPEALAGGDETSISHLVKSVNGMEEGKEKIRYQQLLKDAYQGYLTGDPQLRTKVVAGSGHDKALQSIAGLAGGSVTAPSGTAPSPSSLVLPGDDDFKIPR